MYNKIKKYITISLLSASLLACAGCGKKESSTGASDDEQQTEVSQDESGGDADGDEDVAKKLAADFLAEFADIEKQSEELKNSIDNDDLSQTDYNLKTGDLYTLWDNCLNDLWSVLNQTLSKEEMDKLTEEENTWISDKEKQIADAGAEVEGGSMQPMVENMKGASLTEARVRELVTLLPGGENIGSSDADTSVAKPSDSNASDDKSSNDKLQESNNDLFDSFLAGDNEAVISDKLMNSNIMFDTTFNAGNSFDINTLNSINTTWEAINGIEPKISYTRFDNPNRKAYGLSFLYDLEGTSFTEFYVISENNGQLEINLVVDGWDRRYPLFNKYGVIFDGGSNGAGAHSSNVIVPTADFEYVTLYQEEDNAAGWNFYENGSGDPVQPISKVMDEAFNSGREDISDIIYTQLKVNDSTYYYYLKDDITQDIVDYIDEISDSYDFKFDGKDKAEAAIDEYAKELSADSMYKDMNYVEWNDK